MFSNSLLLLKTVPYVFGVGKPEEFTMAGVIEGNRLATLSLPLWAWSMAFIKMSVCAMMLRLQSTPVWRRFLWGMIIAIIIVTIYNTLCQVLQCIPLHAAWDILGLIQDAKCWSKNAIRINMICVSAFNIITDLISAILPYTFLQKVQIPLRERVVIGVLMGLGIFAAVASILKAVNSANFGQTDDPNLESITIGMWSVIEENVAFIAACIPCLRSPFQKMLERLGVITPRNTTARSSGREGGTYGRMTGDRMTGGAHTLHGAISMRSMKSVTDRSAQSEEDILAAHHKGEIWRTTEVNVVQDEDRKDRDGVARRDWADV